MTGLRLYNYTGDETKKYLFFEVLKKERDDPILVKYLKYLNKLNKPNKLNKLKKPD